MSALPPSRCDLPFVVALCAALLIAAAATAQPPAPEPAAKPAAAAIFEQTLAEQGIEAAVARLREVLADTTSASIVDPFELMRGLPNRLVLQHKRGEALALLKAQEGTFGKAGHYWFELAAAYLRCGDAAGARAALARARDIPPGRPDAAWMLDHLDRLVATARLQAEREDKLVPGGPTGLTGPYLGQTPPGRVPEVFAPGIVCGSANEYHISFTPDGNEIYFSRGVVGTLVCRLRDDGWTAPETVQFIDADHLTEEANVTPDGRAVVFCGRRGLRAERELYRAERAGAGWGTPVKLFPGMYGTSTRDGTLYYTVTTQRPDYGIIVKRRWTGGGYGEPEVVAGDGINTPAPDAHPFIAPDERLLLFDSYREPGAGIYASFRQPDGAWGAAILLNDRLGIPPVGQCALSPDGKYLFFSLANDLYWVDAGFLQELRGR